MPKAVIITALELEFLAVRHHVHVTNPVTHMGTVYDVGTFEAGGAIWDILIAQVGAGLSSAAAETERAVSFFNPEVALFVGVAGGLKDVALGDVIAATKIYAYESGKSEREFKVRPELGNSSHSLVQRSNQVSRDRSWHKRILNPDYEKEPESFVAPIASGSQVVASKRSATFKFLRNSFGDALAVEMEGHGFIQAIEGAHGVNALVIRGISDLVSGKSIADKAGWQRKAANHAAAFAFELLAEFELPERRNQKSAEKSPRMIGNFPSNATRFFGRVEELSRLETALKVAESGSGAIVAISGVSAVGKSQLCREFCLNHKDDFEIVVWIRSADEALIIKDLNRLADAMGIEHMSQEMARDRAFLALNRAGQQESALFIFDNAKHDSTMPFLVQTKANIIINSINPNWSSVASDEIRLSGLATAESVNFLLRRCSSADEESATAVATQVGGFPLALEQVAAYVEETSIDLAEYCQLLEDYRKRLMERPSPFTEYPMSVYAAFQLLYDHLCLESPNATFLLQLLTVCSGESISGAIAKIGIKQAFDDIEIAFDDIVWFDAVADLKRQSFASFGSNYFVIHPLIKNFVLDSLNSEQIERLQRLALTSLILFADFDWRDESMWNRFADSAEHLLGLVRKSRVIDETVPVFFDFVSVNSLYLHSVYRDKEALELAEMAEQIAEKMGKHRDLAMSATKMNLASILERLGRNREALVSMRQAVKLMEKCNLETDEDWQKLGVGYSNLAWHYMKEGNLDRAERLFEKARDIHIRVLGLEHFTTAIDINNLGSIARERKDWRRAVQFHGEAVRIHRKCLGPDDYRLGVALRNLAESQYHSGDLTTALGNAKNALRILKMHSSGFDHPEYIGALEITGILLGLTNNWDSSRDHLEQALDASRRRFGEDHPITKQILAGFAFANLRTFRK